MKKLFIAIGILGFAGVTYAFAKPIDFYSNFAEINVQQGQPIRLYKIVDSETKTTCYVTQHSSPDMKSDSTALSCLQNLK